MYQTITYYKYFNIVLFEKKKRGKENCILGIEKVKDE